MMRLPLTYRLKLPMFAHITQLNSSLKLDQKNTTFSE